jgi:hypothetical protein
LSGGELMACDNADTAAAALLAALAGPKSVTADGMTVVQHDPEQFIKAEHHLAAKCAGTSPRRGLRFTKLKPEGTTE